MCACVPDFPTYHRPQRVLVAFKIPLPLSLFSFVIIVIVFVIVIHSQFWPRIQLIGPAFPHITASFPVPPYKDTF